MRKFKRIFRTVPDPRADNAWHSLPEVLFIALAAVLCGAESFTDMEEFGKAKEDLLRQILPLKHGIPSHDTFNNVFRALDPQALGEALRRFTSAIANNIGLALTGVVAIDGKALRGAYERGRSSTPLHMVNVWAAGARLVLAQCKAPGRNEALGALEVLSFLRLNGCIVTADALHCHRAFALKVLSQVPITCWRSRRIRVRCLLMASGCFVGLTTAASPSNSNHPLTIVVKGVAQWLSATVRWPSNTNSRGLLRSRASAADANPTASVANASCAISFCRNTCRPNGCWPLPELIGRSRIRCTGSSMSSSRRMEIVRARTMLRRTSRSCGGSRST